jgi:hypothetical protein
MAGAIAGEPNRILFLPEAEVAAQGSTGDTPMRRPLPISGLHDMRSCLRAAIQWILLSTMAKTARRSTAMTGTSTYPLIDVNSQPGRTGDRLESNSLTRHPDRHPCCGAFLSESSDCLLVSMIHADICVREVNPSLARMCSTCPWAVRWEITVLTDPNFLHQGQRAYLGYGLVSRRLREPAMRIDELPPIDVIVLSHMHGDHWDRTAQKNLDHQIPVATTPHAAKRLTKRGFSGARGLYTWSFHEVVKAGTRLTITSLPGRHAPGWSRRLLPPVMGSMLEFGPERGTVERRLYLSGDTLVVDDLTAIP